MDYIKKAPSLDDFWQPAVLRDLLLKCAYHAQGHPRKCRCPWCFQGATLSTILYHRADLVHDEGGACRGGCHHERYLHRMGAGPG